MHSLELSTMIHVVRKQIKWKKSINILQGDTLHEENSSCGNRTTNKIMCIHEKGRGPTCVISQKFQSVIKLTCC